MNKTLRRHINTLIAIAMISPALSFAASIAPSDTDAIDRSLQHEINAAIDRSLSWLAAIQKEDGSWSNEKFPALTAMPTWAFIRANHAQSDKVIPSAIDFLKSCVQPDGGIYQKVEGREGGGLINYNTAISMTTLYALGDPALNDIILDARDFVADSQHTGTDIYRGGFGYDATTQRAYTDLMNTMYAAEAMRFTAGAEEARPSGTPRAEVDWDAAADFITSLQNTEADGPDQAGGFFYKPGESKAGTTTNAAGEIVFRSYGSMTYAGMLSLIYAGVDREDPRVRSAFDWAANHWSLEENPGMGMQGYFFFFNVLSRSLNAYGNDFIPIEASRSINWRKAVASKLLSLQKVDPASGYGYWVNEQGRFWENDPILVTSYAVLALQAISGQ